MDTLTQPLLLSLPPVEWVEDVPILYEDEEEGDMGEANLHFESEDILHNGLRAFFADRPNLQAFCNMNLYYRDRPLHPTTGSMPYVSPDNMVVQTAQPLPRDLKSYKIGKDGPVPLLVVEILSERSHQQRDLKEKITLYAQLGVAEYILVDVTGKFLPQKLLLKRLTPEQKWTDHQDVDGGVSSQLGFRILIETDGFLRVTNAVTGEKYARPGEATAFARQSRTLEHELHQEKALRQEAEEKLRALEAELARLRNADSQP